MTEGGASKEPGLSFKDAVLQHDAILGDVNAQYTLGARYAVGKGFPKNPSLSLLWTKRAAEQGHVYAEFLMGLKYEHGKGVVRNLVKARRWYKKAYLHGEEMAYDKLIALDPKRKK